MYFILGCAVPVLTETDENMNDSFVVVGLGGWKMRSFLEYGLRICLYESFVIVRRENWILKWRKFVCSIHDSKVTEFEK